MAMVVVAVVGVGMVVVVVLVVGVTYAMYLLWCSKMYNNNKKCSKMLLRVFKDGASHIND
jgi:hypothetical protein